MTSRFSSAPVSSSTRIEPGRMRRAIAVGDLHGVGSAQMQAPEGPVAGPVQDGVLRERAWETIEVRPQDRHERRDPPARDRAAGGRCGEEAVGQLGDPGTLLHVAHLRFGRWCGRRRGLACACQRDLLAELAASSARDDQLGLGLCDPGGEMCVGRRDRARQRLGHEDSLLDRTLVAPERWCGDLLPAVLDELVAVAATDTPLPPNSGRATCGVVA